MDSRIVIQGQVVLVNLTIAEDGDFPCYNTLSDVNFDGDSLSFSMQTQQGALNVSFDLEDNILNGSLSTPMGNLPIVGRKSLNLSLEWPTRILFW